MSMISPTSGTTTPLTDTTATATPAGAAPLDKQAFLKLLVAQISHQDPLKPMEGTEFVSQLSQFAMVEQAMQQSTSLETLSTQMHGLSNQQATSLVGQTVTMRGKTMAFDGITSTSSAVTLQGPATKVTAEIVDANGKTVRTLTLGGKPAGTVSVVWDGKTDAGQSADKGSYTLKVTATGADGKAVGTTQDIQGVVTKVSFDKGYSELTLDSGATAPLSDMVGVATPAPATK